LTAFIDCNVLVYAYSTDPRRDRALAVVAAGGTISVQVLNEFTNVLRKKQKIAWPVIESAIAAIRLRFPEVAPVTADTHAGAVLLARDHGLAFYDALVVAAALEAGCDLLYSEDMQHGRAFGPLKIIDPFRQ
jgi:predicted nucleic acid-binding protein